MPSKTINAVSLILMWLFISVNSAIAAIEIDTTIAGRSVKIWTPGSGKYPLIIWSHGHRGCNDSSSNLSSMLADEGYMVLAVSHNDCREGGLGGIGGGGLGGIGSEEPWGSPEQWSDQTYRDRRDDWHAVLDDLPNTVFASQIKDLGYIGAVGYSLGGYTVLGLLGGWDSWKRPEIKVVAALSPYSQPYTYHNRVSHFSHDMIQYQGGTRDRGITPGVRDQMYPITHPAKYYVELDGASHFAWSDLRSTFNVSINYYLKSLFNAGLKGMSATPLEVQRSNVDTLYYQH